ncbi:MAG: hypothetical protein U9N56_05865 [Actinomycetota bacterium]|nr:hypothetical protein [Actinomycetota bacterium]
MTTPDQPDPNLASELRATAGSEWAEEAAEDERMTEILRRRRLTMEELFKDMTHRGQRVSVEFGGHSFNGALIASGEDYAVILGPGQVAEVRFDSARWSALPPTDAFEPVPASSPETFVGVLRSHESAETLIRLTLPGSDMVIGKIVTVGVDHVEFADADQRQIYVPTELILGVVRSVDPH